MNLEHVCESVRWAKPLPVEYRQNENKYRQDENGLNVTVAGYGQGENERCIELPLALEVAQLDQPGLVLDAGCSLNRAKIWPFHSWTARLWHYGQSLAAEPFEPLPTRMGKNRVSFLCGDLRHLELADCTCDRIVCVSTLEHIGMDNRQYGGTLETTPQSALDVVYELWRVLKPGGTLFLTFPYGQEPQECGGRYRTLGPEEVARIGCIVAYQPRAQPVNRMKSRYFLRTPNGWIDADASIARGLADGGKPVLGLCCLRAEKELVAPLT